MTAAKKPASKSSSSSRKAAGGPPDAIQLLTTDHAEVRKLFKSYEKLVKDEADDDEKRQLAEQICTMLTVHSTIEEEIFYPASREVLDEQNLVDEAAVEHACAKDLIAQIQDIDPSDELYDAKVKVLGEYIDHHIKEEQDELFPKLKKAGLDLAALGEELMTRKEEITGEVREESTEA